MPLWICKLTLLYCDCRTLCVTVWTFHISSCNRQRLNRFKFVLVKTVGRKWFDLYDDIMSTTHDESSIWSDLMTVTHCDSVMLWEPVYGTTGDSEWLRCFKCEKVRISRKTQCSQHEQYIKDTQPCARYRPGGISILHHTMPTIEKNCRRGLGTRRCHDTFKERYRAVPLSDCVNEIRGTTSFWL